MKGEVPDEEPLHAAFLAACASDHGLISTARYAHGIGGHEGYAASLDQAIWFHRPPRFEDWVLFSSRSPIAHGARALILGQMHARDGTRIASVSQEGLVVRRVRPARVKRRCGERLVAPVSVTAAAAPATAAAALTAALTLRTRLVHRERAAVKHGAVQLTDRLLRLLIG